MADDKQTPPPAKATQEPTQEQRIAALEKQLAAASARVVAMTPQSQVPANGGGPGIDHHLESWHLAAQEAANAGEWHDEWGEEPEPAPVA